VRVRARSVAAIAAFHGGEIALVGKAEPDRQPGFTPRGYRFGSVPRDAIPRLSVDYFFLPELLLLELPRLALVLELELELFLEPPELDLVGMTLSSRQCTTREARWLFLPLHSTFVCSPIVLHEQMRYESLIRRGSAAAARAE
jgi:hypothetical protein